MNFRVFRQAVGQVGRPLIFLCLGAAVFFYIGVWSSASFVSEIQDVPFLQNPPRAIRALVGSADFLHPEGWLASSLGHPISLSLFAGAGLSVAAGSIAMEIERGTIEFILSRPIRRRSFLFGKAFAAIFAVTLVVASGLTGVLIARSVVEKASGLTPLEAVRGFAGAWVLFTSFALIATLISSMSSLRGRAIGVSLGFLVFSFFLNFVALLVDELYPLRLGSLFNYVQADDMIAGRDYLRLVVPLAAGLLSLALATMGFARRDISR